MAEESYRIQFRMKAVCERVTGFRFDRPPGYSFRAGQYFRLTLPTSEGEQTESFSHANAPGDPFLEMATRLQGSPFKNALGELLRGDEVTVSGPYGKLGVPAGTDRVCFLAGGVGITPARSIIRDAEQRRTGLRMRLFYGNHDQACIPYAAELADYERKDRRFQCVHVLEDPLPGWAGDRGLITPELVSRYMGGEDDWDYMISGPPKMVEAMEAVLAELEVPPEHVTKESFAGY